MAPAQPSPPPAFVAAVPVRITDVNHGGHVGNDTVVTLLHEARVRFLASHGFSETDAGGTGLVMRDLEVRFLRQIRYPDEVRIGVAAANPGGASFDLHYRVWAGAEVAAEARTGMGAFDYAAQRPRRLSAALRAALFPPSPDSP